MKDIEKLDQAHVWHPFSPMAGNKPIPVKKAKGLYLHTYDGRKIMDVISSWWVNIHGHGHPKVAKAISKQAHRLEQVIFAGFTHKPAVKLTESLLKLLPAHHKIFFSDNGSTSTEVALKLAIQYWKNQGVSRKRIIALEGAYHGDTFGAMSLGGKNTFTFPFEEYLFEVDFIPFPRGDGSNSIEAMKKLAKEDAAAFIFEPLVQGAAGMKMYAPEVLESLLEIAHSKQIITIADEVMTGFGRTGKLFACDYITQNPDIMCLSKGLTAGFLPMGLTVVNRKISEAFDVADKTKAFFHGHSYTANPMACAAANASMKILLKKNTNKKIEEIELAHKSYISRFQDHPQVEDVRMRGTILAIELKADDKGYTSNLKEMIYDHFMARDILLRPLGNVIYLIPPYIITLDELNSIYHEIDLFLEGLL